LFTLRDFFIHSSRNFRVEIAAEGHDYAKAEALIKNSLKKDPDNAYTLMLYAQILEQQGDHEGSLQYLSKAREVGMDIICNLFFIAQSHVSQEL
jgi:Tfp pilus assembly protein PilF